MDGSVVNWLNGPCSGRTEKVDATATRLEARLRAGHRVVTAELSPPRHAGTGVLRAEARALRGFVDAVNLTDGNRAIVRMSPIAAAVVVHADGVEPVVQLTCRDRNRIALQADLLGLPALGLHNVLLLRGDDPALGDHPDAKPVFDLDGTGLLAAADRMRREGRLLSGGRVAEPPSLFLGAPGDPERDLAAVQASQAGTGGPPVLAAKVAAGADFVQTQVVSDPVRFTRWIDLAGDAGLLDRVAVLAGVFVLDSARRAEFLRDKVPGVVVPDATVARLAGARDERAEGVALAVELVGKLLAVDGVRGVHLMGLGPAEDRCAVVEAAGLLDEVRAGGSP
jgi:methylenetetrahydrofolate reductase (NADPH)